VKSKNVWILVLTSLLTITLQNQKVSSLQIDEFTLSGKVSETKNNNYSIGREIELTFQNVSRTIAKSKKTTYQFESKEAISKDGKKFCDLVIKKNQYKILSVNSYFGTKKQKNIMTNTASTNVSFGDKKGSLKGVCTIFYSISTGIDEKENEINQPAGKYGVIVFNLQPRSPKIKPEKDPSIDYALIVDLD
jgi:hypothetical protein